MRILYIGAGFVGACSAAVSSDSGHETIVYDIDAKKIADLASGERERIQSWLYEEGLAEMIQRNRSRLQFVSDIRELTPELLSGVEAVFMCVPTPEKNDGSGATNLSHYEASVATIAPLLAGIVRTHRLVIVNKSTVPVQMIDYTHKLFSDAGLTNFGIVANPEFLVEGKAIENSIRPDRVVVGANSPEDFAIMRRVYQRFCDASAIDYIEINPYEAAAGKLLANYILFNKVVTTFSVVGRLCEIMPNLQYENLRKMLVADPRIGGWGLYDSLYAGGSCFIKDAGSLAHQIAETGTVPTMVQTTLSENEFQLNHFFDRVEIEAKRSWAGATVAVLGLAFKQDTNDMRNSGALALIQRMLGAGVAAVNAYDPAALPLAAKIFDSSQNNLYTHVKLTQSETEAVRGADIVVIAADWPQFKQAATVITECAVPGALILDGRRSLQHQYSVLQSQGFSILAVGSPFLPSLKK